MVYIIILNWNGLIDTIECIESCTKLDYTSFRIILVDNCSEDGSELVLKKLFPDIVVLQTGNNLGYAGGNNIGIRYAFKESADYVWLLNNDTVVDSKALTELVTIAETDPAYGMVGSKIFYYSEPSLLYYAGGWVDVNLGASGHLGIGQKDNHQYDNIVETGYISGCSLLVKRSVVEDIGLMNEDYFLYFEESEWCIKAKRSGYRLLYVPGSVIYHKESASTRKISGAISYYMTRNRLYFIGRNGTNVRWLRRFSLDMINLVKCFYNRDFTQFSSMLFAYWNWFNGLVGRHDCLHEIQRHNDLSDR